MSKKTTSKKYKKKEDVMCTKMYISNIAGHSVACFLDKDGHGWFLYAVGNQMYGSYFPAEKRMKVHEVFFASEEIIKKGIAKLKEGNL